jgi:hypothetical protein
MLHRAHTTYPQGAYYTERPLLAPDGRHSTHTPAARSDLRAPKPKEETDSEKEDIRARRRYVD